MATVLLFDDDILFKAVEGTCLRRERCRLVTAPVSPPTSAASRVVETGAGMILASSATPRAALTPLFEHRDVRGVPMIIVDLGGPAGLLSAARRASKGREAPIRILKVPLDGAGRLDFASLDPLFDAALREHLPELDHRTDRVPLSLSVQCRGRGLTATLRTKNISPTGLFLKTGGAGAPAARFRPGRKFEFSMRIPPAAEAESREGVRLISGRCEVVRRVKSGGRKPGAPPSPDLIPGIGVRFVDLGEDERRALRRFVRKARPASRTSATPAH